MRRIGRAARAKAIRARMKTDFIGYGDAAERSRRTLGLLFLEHGNLMMVLIKEGLDRLALLNAALLAGLTLNNDQ